MTSPSSEFSTIESDANVLMQARGITKAFDHGGRRIDVLKGIDLDVRAGEMISIVGISGAGKSTLLQILGTLDRPSSGQLRFDDRNLVELSGHEVASFRNRTIGFVFQFHHLLPEFTALENVMMPCLIHRTSRKKAADQALDVLQAVGLEDRKTHRPDELSGGEQQRVALARALVMSPKLLLADEPTGNLDSQTSQKIFDLIETLNDRLGVTTIVVTHNPEFAERMPRRLRMVDGRIEQAAH